MSRPLRIEFSGAVYHVTSRALHSQVYLGDANFMQRMQKQMQPHQKHDEEIPKSQRMRAQSWATWLSQCRGHQDQALYHAFRQGGMTMTQLARDSGLSITHVSSLIARTEREEWET